MVAVIPPIRSEDLGIEGVAKLPIDVGPLKVVYNAIKVALKDLDEGRLVTSWFAIKGYYGTGKTLLLRRIAHEAVHEYRRIVPIYFYMGKFEEILLLKSLGEFVNLINGYSTGRVTPDPRIIGRPEDWRDKVVALQKVYNEVEERHRCVETRDPERCILGFFDAMRRLTDLGYIPLVVFDELERLIYTGEGVRESTSALRALALIGDRFHELIRGHFFAGAGVVALTDSLPELVRKAGEREPKPPFVSRFESLTGKRYVEIGFTNPSIYFSGDYWLIWTSSDLKELCSKLGIDVAEEIVELMSQILPTPRALFNVIEKARLQGVELKSRSSLLAVIKPKLEALINRLKVEKIDNRPLLYASSRWDEQLVKLLQNGYLVIRRPDLPAVGKILRENVSEDKAKFIAEMILHRIYRYGIFEKVKGVYSLNKILLSYMLDIDRLPTGDEAREERVVSFIKDHVKKHREDMKKYRISRVKKNVETG